MVKRLNFGRIIEFGPSSLAIQYWEIHVIINERNVDITDTWDGSSLTFIKGLDQELMIQWFEILQIAQS